MKKSTRITISSAGLIILLLTGFLATNYWIWRHNFQNRLFPRIRVGGLALGGDTLPEAIAQIQTQTQKLENDGLLFRYKDQTKILPAAVVSFDSDLSYQSLFFDPAATAEAAFGPPTQRTFLDYLAARYGLRGERVVPAVYTLDQNRVQQFLADNFSNLNIEPQNAYFSLTGNQANGFRLQNNPAQIGKNINYPAVFATLNRQLAALEPPIVDLETRSQYPTIQSADLAELADQAQAIIGRGNFFINSATSSATTDEAASTESWKVGPREIITWVTAARSGQGTQLILDPDKISAYLSAHIAPQVDRAAVAPRFVMVDGRVTDWQAGTAGYEINLKASAQALAEAFLAGRNQTNLIMEELPEQDSIGANSLNIRTIIGTGVSNFRGSPPNRVHNIEVGAAALKGLLIKPGEEFSLVKALGEIDAKSGYLPELVIKGDETTPEYGGGLCQIGTTMFRTALAAGLPITMRQNHSYRVSYYEPAGTDATIYDPLPDLRFINDTGNYILIQPRIEKNNLYFDFWGTSDGRIASTTAPVIYNIVKPAPTKIIETTSLKPGEKKCTESSHNGADAYFDYTVTYPVGATTTPVHNRRFSSHYVPWQAVCLVGVAPTSTVATSSIATSTAATTTTP